MCIDMIFNSLYFGKHLYCILLSRIPLCHSVHCEKSDSYVSLFNHASFSVKRQHAFFPSSLISHIRIKTTVHNTTNSNIYERNFNKTLPQILLQPIVVPETHSLTPGRVFIVLIEPVLNDGVDPSYISIHRRPSIVYLWGCLHYVARLLRGVSSFTRVHRRRCTLLHPVLARSRVHTAIGLWIQLSRARLVDAWVGDIYIGARRARGYLYVEWQWPGYRGLIFRRGRGGGFCSRSTSLSSVRLNLGLEFEWFRLFAFNCVVSSLECFFFSMADRNASGMGVNIKNKCDTVQFFFLTEEKVEKWQCNKIVDFL